MKNSIILSLVFISVVLIIIISTFGDASTYVSFTEAQSMYSSGNLSKIHVVGKLNKNKNQEIIGVNKLISAPLMATDLRASISLVIAALGAKGQSVISRIYHLDRGYEKIENKLRNVGVDIKRTS